MIHLALAFALSTTLFINNFQARLLNHGTFFSDISNKGFADGGTQTFIDENFHQCGLNEICSFVVRNIKTEKNSLISSEKDLPSKQHDLVIWKRGISFYFLKCCHERNDS